MKDYQIQGIGKLERQHLAPEVMLLWAQEYADCPDAPSSVGNRSFPRRQPKLTWQGLRCHEGHLAKQHCVISMSTSHNTDLARSTADDKFQLCMLLAIRQRDDSGLPPPSAGLRPAWCAVQSSLLPLLCSKAFVRDAIIALMSSWASVAAYLPVSGLNLSMSDAVEKTESNYKLQSCKVRSPTACNLA